MFNYVSKEKEITVPLKEAAARSLFTRSLELIGRIKSTGLSQRKNCLITGITSYGLQRIPISIELWGNGESSTVVKIIAECLDNRGVASTESITRLTDVCHALSADDPAALKALLQKDKFRTSLGISKMQVLYLILIVIGIGVGSSLLVSVLWK